MKIRPLANRVVIKPLEEEEKTSGGIILPDTAKEKPLRGKVIAVGQGKSSKNGKSLPPEVKEGEIVVYEKYAGTEFKINNEEFLILKDDDILAVIEK